MKARGWGRIIQIGTGLANTPQPVLADYAAARAALVNLTVSLAKAVAGTNIKVNTMRQNERSDKWIKKDITEIDLTK